MRFGCPIFFAAVFAASFAASPQTPPAAQKKTAPAPKAAPKSAAVKRKGKSPGRPAAAGNWKPRQLTPTPDRYKEIQQALADKGYLKSEPNGVWDADSTEALQKFQIDQKLAPTGKITASSLIGLGLGPKTAGPVAGSVTPPPAEPPKP